MHLGKKVIVFKNYYINRIKLFLEASWGISTLRNNSTQLWRLELLLLVGLYCVSRFFFLSSYPHFYDSPEYVREAQNAFWISIASAHNLLHPIYLFLTQRAWDLNPGVISLSALSALFGLLSLLMWYSMTAIIWDKQVAFKASLVWLAFNQTILLQTNALHESIDLTLMLGGLLAIALHVRTRSWWYYCVGVGAISSMLVNSLAMLVWLPVFVVLWLLVAHLEKIPKKLSQLIIMIFASLVIAITASQAITIRGLGDAHQRISNLYTEATQIKALLTPFGILRSIRNGLVVVIFGYSPLAVVVAWISAVKLWLQRRWYELGLLMLLLMTYVGANGFYYGGLYGRFVAAIGLVIALLTAFLPRKAFGLVFVSVLLMTTHTMSAYRRVPIPEIQRTMIEQLPNLPESVLILSDTQRPQLDDTSAIFLHSFNGLEIQETIEAHLNKDRRVYISQQAMTAPYWQYDGQHIHVLTKGNPKKAILFPYLQTLHARVVVSKENYPLLTLYELSRKQ